MNRQPKYQFYATLLDKFQGWLSSSEIYQEYWGFSEEPSKTEEEFEQEQFQGLIDTINRVPFDSEAADQGTVFNEIVDCIILQKNCDKMKVEKIYSLDCEIEPNTGEPMGRPIALKALYKEREFIFPIALCTEFASYYKGATPQVYVEAILSTRYGDVNLYGYIDELMPLSVHDIKMTSKYSAGKFKKNWQHIVYPYCLNANGNQINDFEYNVAVLNKTSYNTFTEHYAFVPCRDIQKLTNHVELLIEFIEKNRELITDNKIFNYQQQAVSL